MNRQYTKKVAAEQTYRNLLPSLVINNIKARYLFLPFKLENKFK